MDPTYGFLVSGVNPDGLDELRRRTAVMVAVCAPDIINATIIEHDKKQS